MRAIAAIVALLLAPAALAAFKCTDEKGATHIGDTPPPGCAAVVMYETSASGLVVRKIDPTPTGAQLKAREEEQRKRREADKVAAEQKRYDTALLSTYATEKEFEVARDRNLEPLNGRIRLAQERIKEVDKRMAKIAEEKEFYTAGRKKTSKAAEVPHNLVAEEERLAKEKQTLTASIASTEKEIVAQRERFERDRKHWLELRSGMTTPVAERK